MMNLRERAQSVASTTKSVADTTSKAIVSRMPEAVRARVFPPPPPSRLRRALPMIGAGAAGAVAAFLFDPDRGRARRAKLVDMSAGLIRRGGRRAARAGRRLSLANKVRSEVLGDPEFRTADIMVNVDSGVVTLRGTLDRPEQILRLEKEVAKLPGVAGVENLVHPKGTEPANKRAEIEASNEAMRSRPV